MSRPELQRALSNALDNDGVTLRTVADAVGVSHGTVANWRHGRRVPTTDQLSKLMDTLNVDAATRRLIMAEALEVAPGRLPGTVGL